MSDYQDKAVISFVQNTTDILYSAQVGMWYIVIGNGDSKFYMDMTTADLVGVTSDESPEKAYEFWHNNIDTDYLDEVSRMVGVVLTGEPGEVVYTYHHPTRGDITVRCGGVIDSSYLGEGTRIKGYHQDISSYNMALLEQKSITKAMQKHFELVLEIDLMRSRVRMLAASDNTYDERFFGYLSLNDAFDPLCKIVAVDSLKDFKETVSVESLQSVLNTQKSITREIETISRGWYRIVIIPSVVRADGLVEKCLYCTEYINEEKQKEKEQKELLKDALAQAEQASTAKTIFLSNMSHDIRTPMNAIAGYTELALNNLGDPAKTDEYLNKIKKAGSTLESLINDILDMSRIEAGKVVITESRVSLTDIFTNLCNIVQVSAEKKGVLFELDMSELTDDCVWCDKVRLMQVLQNCVSNSIKFTPAGGKVVIRVKQSDSGISYNSNFTISIRDTGIGMDPEFVEHMFEPFERERSSTVSGIQGTGLGMAITKNLLNLMGGVIDVKSKKGEGTEFIISLMLRQAVGVDTENVVIDSITRERSIKGLRVLLVEDNEMNREIASEILKEYGAMIMIATDGLEAVKKMEVLSARELDLILMDIEMPVMNGYDATRKIRQMKDGEYEKLPIIAMTANAFEEDKKMAMEAGMNAHIAKPINIDAFFNTIIQCTQTGMSR